MKTQIIAHFYDYILFTMLEFAWKLACYKNLGAKQSQNKNFFRTILTLIGLKRGFTFVDVGCGYGFFTLPTAKLVGKQGTVYGLDANDEAIRKLTEKAAENGVDNLYLTVGEAEETIFCEACADIVFFGIVLHDFGDPTKVLKNSKRMVKPTGKLVDLDWKKERMQLGPPLHIRFSEKEATSLMRHEGFKIDAVSEVGPDHYLIKASL
jgi:ubiquinone/menaquinone biosynthesis C-methylase UbiE